MNNGRHNNKVHKAAIEVARFHNMATMKTAATGEAMKNKHFWKKLKPILLFMNQTIQHLKKRELLECI